MATLNEEKYRNAILYFAHHVRQVGRTKLWKLLYYLDFDHYERYGTAVTGEQYRKWSNGPVPSAGLALLERMRAAGDVEIIPEPTGLEYPLLKVRPNRSYDKSVFTTSEREMLEAVARKWKFHSARDMSNATHGERPWLEAEQNGVLDYALASQRGSDANAEEFSETSGEDADMDALAKIELARQRALVYAERIERACEANPELRARIELGRQQLKSGQYVEVDVEQLIRQRRESARPS